MSPRAIAPVEVLTDADVRCRTDLVRLDALGPTPVEARGLAALRGARHARGQAAGTTMTSPSHAPRARRAPPSLRWLGVGPTDFPDTRVHERGPAELRAVPLHKAPMTTPTASANDHARGSDRAASVT
jgi:hypothetical protein